MFKCFSLRVSVIRVFRVWGFKGLVVVFHFWLGRNKHDPKYNIVPFRHILEKQCSKQLQNLLFEKDELKRKVFFSACNLNNHIRKALAEQASHIF